MTTPPWLGWWLAVGASTWALVLAQHACQRGGSFGRSLRAPAAASSSRAQQFLLQVLVPLLASVVIVVAWPLAWAMGAQELHRWFRARRRRQAAAFKVRSQDLIRATTVAEVEQGERIRDPMGAVPDQAFGHLHGAWRRFVAHRPPHSHLWAFARQWTDERGRVRDLRGYVWVRWGRRTPWWTSHDRFCERSPDGQ